MTTTLDRSNIDNVTPNRLAAVADDRERYIEAAHREIEHARQTLADIEHLLNQGAYGAAINAATSPTGPSLPAIAARLADDLTRARRASEIVRTGVAWH